MIRKPEEYRVNIGDGRREIVTYPEIDLQSLLRADPFTQADRRNSMPTDTRFRQMITHSYATGVKK